MGNELKLEGAWICPDGKIHWTDNIQSHSKVINELGIKDQLQKAIYLLSSDEIKNHKDSDLAYIALKLGYIRIIYFQSEFSIQYGKIPFDELQITSILEVFDTFRNRTDQLITFFNAEQFEKNFYSFDDYDQFYQFLQNNRIM